MFHTPKVFRMRLAVDPRMIAQATVQPCASISRAKGGRSSSLSPPNMQRRRRPFGGSVSDCPDMLALASAHLDAEGVIDLVQHRLIWTKLPSEVASGREHVLEIPGREPLRVCPAFPHLEAAVVPVDLQARIAEDCLIVTFLGNGTAAEIAAHLSVLASGIDEDVCHLTAAAEPMAAIVTAEAPTEWAERIIHRQILGGPPQAPPTARLPPHDRQPDLSFEVPPLGDAPIFRIVEMVRGGIFGRPDIQ